MKRVAWIVLVVFAIGCGRKVVVHPDKLATKGDGAWRISSEPGSAPAPGAPAATSPPLPPTSPQGTPTAPPPPLLPPTTPPRR